jgi:phosphomannomutase
MGIFKAYDIRGVYPNEINEKIAYRIAQACGKYFGGEKALVGGDCRLSTPLIKKAVIEGLLNEGLDVYDLGMVSTSTFNFLISKNKFDFGLQITASHNPREYNGIKVYDSEGNTVGLGFGLEKIEKIFKKIKEGKRKEKKGEYIEAKNLIEQHRKFLERFLEKFEGKVAIDYSNGCGSIVFSELIKGINAIELNKEINGNFPSHPPEPTKENLTYIQEVVKREKCSFGAAFDGDADRIVFLDEKGNVLRGDQTLFLFSKFLKPKKVVFEVSFPVIFKEELKKMGVECFESKVGRVMINEMRKNDADLGGEISSHFYYKETNFMEDAFLTFFKFMQILKKEGKNVSELIKEYFVGVSQSYKVEVKDEEKFNIVEKIKEKIAKDYGVITIDGVKVILDEKNWFLIRASNTEPIIRILIEGENEEKLKENKKIVENYLNKFNLKI